MNVGDIAGRRMPRIDHHDLGAAFLPRGDEALIEHRMTPRRVAADQNDEIGCFDIVVAAGHDILAEGANMTGDRRGHAEPRIGVDIGAADKSLHQLVGDVIVLGQKLAGDVERHRVRPMIGYGLRESAGDTVERFVPARIAAADLRIKQPAHRWRACRRAPRPSSRAGRNWRDGPRLPRPRRPPRRASRSRRRNRDRWCRITLLAIAAPQSPETASALPRRSACAAMACSAKARPKTI